MIKVHGRENPDESGEGTREDRAVYLVSDRIVAVVLGEGGANIVSQSMTREGSITFGVEESREQVIRLLTAWRLECPPMAMEDVGPVDAFEIINDKVVPVRLG